MQKKKKTLARYPDYEVVDTKDIVTFGTSVLQRKDGAAFIIIFPAGQELHLKPQSEIDNEKA